MWKLILLLHITFLLSDGDAQKVINDQKLIEQIEVSDVADSVEAYQNDFTYRLPNNTKPESYLISMEFRDFHEGDMSFTGRVWITIRVLENTNQITLHSSVRIDEVVLTYASLENSVHIESTYNVDVEHPKREFLIITTTETLTVGSKVQIDITYQGNIGTSIAGVYRGSYMNVENNDERYFLATHMQPSFFRRVCPGYDEPSFKATFRLMLTHNRMFLALSNMPKLVPVDQGNGRVMTVFDVSPLMSTYIFAFVICDFNSGGQFNAGQTIFQVFSRSEQTSNTAFALETGVKALELYESAFETKYELPKLDQVALPVFNSGGMENYGIVFYREDYLLYEPSVTTAHDKELVAATIVHEICHKFLGNLLTPHWWSVLWLSEGFCRFYEYYMTQKIYPAMRMEELFAVEKAQSIMRRDSSETTRPMTWYEESPEAVARLLSDDIAYSKSASVIRMFQHSLSEQTFNKGLKIYLSKSTSNPEGVAEPEHFYEALQQAADEDNTVPSIFDVKRSFESWEKQAGYPVLYVERSYNNHMVVLTQNRFTDSIEDGTQNNSLWYIPITYASKIDPTTDTTPKFWMSERRVEFLLEDVKPNSYLIMNIKQTGYYRVQYDEPNWMLIANELSHGNFSSIPPNSRAMLIDDAAVFYEKRILKIRILLELIKYLQHDIDYIPWKAATKNLKYMRLMLDDGSSELSKDFKRFLRVLLAKTFDAFGVEEVTGEPHYHKHIRNIAINWACQAHLDSCVTSTQNKFKEFMEAKRVQFSNDHKASIFCNGILMAKAQEFEFMWNLFNSASDATRRKFYLESIGCIGSEEILTRFINKVLDNDINDNGNDEWMTIIEAVYRNGPIGMKVAQRFLRTEYDFIGLLQQLYPTSLESLLMGMAERINTQSFQKEILDLLDLYNIDSETKSKVTTITNENLNWIATYSDDIQDFLNDFFGSSSTSSKISCFIIVFGLAINWIMQN